MHWDDLAAAVGASSLACFSDGVYLGVRIVVAGLNTRDEFLSASSDHV